jgi:hypothetical protein
MPWQRAKAEADKITSIGLHRNKSIEDVLEVKGRLFLPMWTIARCMNSTLGLSWTPCVKEQAR